MKRILRPGRPEKADYYCDVTGMGPPYSAALVVKVTAGYGSRYLLDHGNEVAAAMREAAWMAPCSVNANGSLRRPPWGLELEVAFCDIKFTNSCRLS